MSNNEKTITVFDENGKAISILVLFTFSMEKRTYIVYTLEEQLKNESVNVLISEIDMEAKKIKEIPQEEIATVTEYYEQVKKILIN